MPTFFLSISIHIPSTSFFVAFPKWVMLFSFILAISWHVWVGSDAFGFRWWEFYSPWTCFCTFVECQGNRMSDHMREESFKGWLLWIIWKTIWSLKYLRIILKMKTCVPLKSSVRSFVILGSYDCRVYRKLFPRFLRNLGLSGTALMIVIFLSFFCDCMWPLHLISSFTPTLNSFLVRLGLCEIHLKIHSYFNYKRI